MAECGKRPRDRPKGSCLDDAATPARIAEPDPGVVRRLQRKFRDDQPALMDAARPPARRRPLIAGYGPMRLWGDDDIRCRYGLAAAGAIALFAGGLEAASWGLGAF